MTRQSFGSSDQPKAAPSGPEARTTAAAVSEKARLDTDPTSSEVDSTHDELVALFAATVGRTPDEGYRRELLAAIRLGYEPKAERYWQLLATINGWPPIPSAMPAWAWFIDALAARLP